MPDSEHLPYLRIKGELEGLIKRIQITSFPFTIGREPNNDLQIANPTVSRYHAEIHQTAEGRYTLIDKKSKHGTRINGTRITESVLADGDEIILAYQPPTILRFELSRPAVSDAGSDPGSNDGNIKTITSHPSVPGQFQSEDLEYLMATARAAGLVIENLRHEELAKITEELREAMARLAETQDQLLHAEHLASLGTLTAGVAHEINNPLAAILQSLDTALGRCAQIPDEKMRGRIEKPLQRARDNGWRIKRIVQDLRTFSRAERVRGEKADVRQEIESAFQILEPLAKSRQIQLQSFFGDLDWIEAPPTRLSQLLINIIQNAIHASADGARVEAYTGRAKAPGGATGDLAGDPGKRGQGDSQNDYAWIQIRDYGAGMAPEVKARIFDPFFTTKPVGVETGLGLWVCQSIIKSLGGTIQVESEPGKGTTFTLNLRLFNPDDATPDDASKDASSTNRGDI